MELFKKLQAKREAIKPTIVHLKDLGADVEILPPFLSHRIALIQNEKATDQKMYSFLVVANCLSEKGIRQIDDLGYEEIAANLDLMTEQDLLTLFDACQEISKVTIKDVEEAQKN